MGADPILSIPDAPLKLMMRLFREKTDQIYGLGKT